MTVTAQSVVSGFPLRDLEKEGQQKHTQKGTSANVTIKEWVASNVQKSTKKSYFCSF